MALTHLQKSVILNKIVEDWRKAKSLFFSGYAGLSVKNMGVLRKELRAVKGQYTVAKKTLVKRAAKNLNLPEIPDSVMPGAVGVVFGYDDPVVPAKILAKFGKEHPEVTILGGFMDGKVLSASEAKYLSTIPGREELLARLVGSIKAPISGFHAVLSGVLRGFITAISEISKKRGAEGGATGGA